MEAVLGALTNPRAKGALKGIETHNMGTQNFDKIAQKLSIYLPLAKIASSDAHIYWAIGAGRTEFPGETAAGSADRTGEKHHSAHSIRRRILGGRDQLGKAHRHAQARVRIRCALGIHPDQHAANEQFDDPNELKKKRDGQ
jgi:predicted metal-dependent phosphoesterase TrpH